MVCVYLTEAATAGFAPDWQDRISFGRMAMFMATSLIGVTLVANALIVAMAPGAGVSVAATPAP
ncbi:MAG: hypothetical protein AAF631_13000 [Pseudomonadota bacterium]